jgi:4-hydroxyphenylpyruvate dioxygenase-like putative hemolysin
MTAEDQSSLHHVVFAVAPQRRAAMAQMFTDLGFAFEKVPLPDLGVDVALDWNRGVELISPTPGSEAPVARSVTEFLDAHGDGIYTVVLRVPGAPAAEAVAQRYGATTRFRQSFEGDGTHLEEVDLSVLGLPLTFLATNIP